MLFLGCFTVSAQTDDRLLAEQYAPILYFVSGEECFPVEVEYLLDNSELKTEEVEGDLVSYYDNLQGTINDNGVISHYQQNMNMYGYTVYAHVTSDGGAIQYWFFYAFNKGELNQHEGDWEMVQIIFSGGTPQEVGYSQHHSGQSASWDQVERQGDHIKVFVAQGSHANYLRSYSGMIGVASDIVGADGKVLEFGDYDLISLSDQEWLDFAGRWGEYGGVEQEIRGQNGPPGPQFREGGTMWNSPLGWENNLQQANNTIFIVELLLYHFVLIVVAITVITLAVLMYRIYLRYKKTGLGPRIISMFYIDGANPKSIGNILCIIGIIVAVIALFQPWYSVSADIGVEGYETSGMVDIISIDGINGVIINMLDPTTGPMPLGSFTLPFSLLIGIGLVFLVIAAVGIASSKKLGKKYIYRGIKLLVPVVILIVLLSMIGMLSSAVPGVEDSEGTVAEVLQAIASSPMGGATSLAVQDTAGQISFSWGLGLGAILLLLSGILLLVAGILEIFANTTFYKK